MMFDCDERVTLDEWGPGCSLHTSELLHLNQASVKLFFSTEGRYLIECCYCKRFFTYVRDDTPILLTAEYLTGLSKLFSFNNFLVFPL
jgi:hypothetical protein